MQTTKDFTNAILVRKALNTKSDDWQETADQWLVTINGQTFDFYTGVGLRKKSRLGGEGIPQKPELDTVLYSLVMDAVADEIGYDVWCDELGYDTDSRKALNIYLSCQENAAKLRKAGFNIDEERERLQDY